MKKVFAALIILILPTVVSAHGAGPTFDFDAGVLPGSPKYFWERAGEWMEINLFTVSTKKKQAKKLENASERVAELTALFEQANPKLENLEEALRRYRYFVNSAEDMAEKLVILDGAQIGAAEQVERATRVHEQVLAELLEEDDLPFAGVVREAVTTARLANEKTFKFMIQNYQFNDADIRKHQNILEQHIHFVELRLGHNPVLDEARKFQKAGLNREAYDLMQKAKNILY